jgi:hypothetical protein
MKQIVSRYLSRREDKTGYFSTEPSILLLTGFILLFFLALWIFIAFTRIGLIPDIDFWNEAGVPVSGLQILLAFVFSLVIGYFLFSRLGKHQPLAQKTTKKKLALDLVIGLALWGLAAGIWLAEPMRQSFNAPRPSPPYYEFFPFSDSTAYDIGGQFVLIGQGINNDLLTDKPLYMFFLAILHWVGGQSQSVVIGYQVLVLAAFPVILYLLGKEIHSRGAGILIALLAIFKERNAIASALDIQVSHSKLMMTEVPTALLISIVVLLLFRWLKDQSLRLDSLPYWIGGVIGAATLMRANSVVLLPLALLIPFLVKRTGWRHLIATTGALLFGFAFVVSPWILTNRDAQGRTALQVKLEGVLERYQQADPDGSGMELLPQADGKMAALPQPSEQAAALFIRPATNISFMQETPRDTDIEQAGGLGFIPAHFLHNQIAAVFILPLTWTFQDPSYTVNSQLWDPNWSGAITFENGIMLLFNLSLISFGLAFSWRRWRTAGLVPILVEVFYFLANALARTSGGRYLVPVDWVVYFYYGLGLFQFANWALQRAGLPDLAPEIDATPSHAENRARLFWLTPTVSLLALGMLLPLSGVLIPQRYPLLNSNETYKTLESQVSLTEMGFTRQEIGEFLKSPDAVVFQGRLLYPRYLLAGEGLCKKCYVLDAAFGIRPYARLAFVGLGPFSAGVIVEMENLPANFRSINLLESPDVWVIGCKEHEDVLGMFKGFYPSVRGLIIAISSEKEIQVYRQPNQKLNCE